MSTQMPTPRELMDAPPAVREWVMWASVELEALKGDDMSTDEAWTDMPLSATEIMSTDGCRVIDEWTDMEHKAELDAKDRRIAELEDNSTCEFCETTTDAHTPPVCIPCYNKMAVKWLNADRRIAELEAALKTISEWPFDIMGDCVADAKRLANSALRGDDK